VFFLIYTWRFGNAGLGLAPYGPVQSNPFLHILVWHFMREFKTNANISSPDLREKPRLAFE
jgi:hypothetical protein